MSKANSAEPLIQAGVVLNTLNTLKTAQCRIQRLEEALDSALNVLADIRYQNWPTEGLGIGLSAERLDEVLMIGERVLPKPPTKKTKRPRKGKK